MKILLVVYDNDSHISWFPQGLSYIAAVLRQHGYEIEIYNQDWHHYPDSHLTQYLDEHKFDVIGVSVIGGYYQYRKLNSLSQAINASKQRPFYIIGGHGPSPDPEFFLKKTKADVVVMGEGEVTIVELLEALGSKKSLNHVNGIAFRDGDTVVINEPRPLIKDIDTIPFPAYDLFPVEYHRLMRIIPYLKPSEFVMPVLTGRGCKFQCNFCYRMDKGLRIRKNEAIIEEIKYLKQQYNIRGFLFSDELLMTSLPNPPRRIR